MKKRLLITSIVMMLVVAVALSTATYAWFTSSAAVTASTVSLTASSNSGASIGIAWGNADDESTSINAKAASGTWDPMVPLTLTSSTTSAVTFTGATIRTEGGVQKFNEASSKTPFKYTSDDDTPVEFFHVKNLSAANVATVTLTLKDVSGASPVAITDANSLLRVGVFTSSTYNGTYTLAAVMGVSAGLNTEWGNVQTDGDVATLTADSAEVPTVISYAFNLDANASLFFRVIAWMDGVALNDTTAGSIANFGLNFAAEKYVQP